MASIKGNILLNALNTITSIIFPVITFPYAARVLMPEGIGTVNFLNSIISYIVLFTSIGIPMYAVKEIAKYKDDRYQRDKATIELIVFSSMLCILGYIAVWALARFVPQIHEQSSLFYILSLTIVFTTIGVNWFYQGIEDFKFITIRAIIVRALSATALFIFVKDSSDLLIYGCIIVGSTVGNNIINFVHLRKHIIIKNIYLKDLNILRHLKPALQVFVLNLIVSLYIQLNSIMLGFLSDDESIGFFTAGTKISHIGLTIISSLSTVLLPRCSNLIKTGKIEEFNTIIHKSLNLTLGLSVPMTIGLMVLATPITLVFCGNEYYDAIPVLLLNAPVIIFISLTNLMGIQILYPKDKLNIVIWSVSCGAILNIVFNFTLIPHYGATGAAISTLIAEFTVLVFQMIFGRGDCPFDIKDLFNFKYLLGGIIMGLITYFSVFMINSYLMKLITGLFIGIISYSIYLIIVKDQLFIEVKSYLKRVCHGKQAI